MVSKRCFFICVVLFLCVLSFSSKALARNIPNVSELSEGSDKMYTNKRVLGQEAGRPACKRGRLTYTVSRIQDDPRCHHYL
ncbi:unnamed protein product [Lathyrus oleraceus]